MFKLFREVVIEIYDFFIYCEISGMFWVFNGCVFLADWHRYL